MNWTEGYVAEVDYVHEYSGALNPAYASFAAALAGHHVSEFSTCCELGFGQGTCIAIHSAAGEGVWWGTDFNPSQAGFARDLAGTSGANAHLFDQAFDEFCCRPDLPDFDFIGLHGIWSWINDENRAVITDFVRRKLKPGGVLYISYNTWPGFAAFLPLRDLLWQHATLQSATNVPLLDRIENAFQFGGRLKDVKAGYFAANPQVEKRFDLIKKLPGNYLAHEYFNRDWHPMPFSQMAKWLEPTKLSYACSAYFFDHVDTINLTSNQREFLADIPDLMFRELVRDFMVNQQFRRDYWVKGPRALTRLEQVEAIRRQRVILGTYRPEVSLKVIGVLGEATMQDGVYNPILDVLASNTPQTFADIEAKVSSRGISFVQLKEAITLLTGAGHLLPVRSDEAIASAKSHTDRLNAYLIEKARSSGDINYLASPVTGGGINVPRFQQLFIRALRQGKTAPEQWAESTWRLLAAQNECVIKDGNALDTPESNLEELTRQAKEFADKRLLVLKALQIV